jgi:hypothetical protein
MRDKFIKKLAIVGLAAIFLLSMSSYAPPQKGKGGKDKGPPELYEVSISINGSGPGIENQDMYGNPVCGSKGYFYAEKEKSGRNVILIIKSQGSDTPGPAPYYEVAPLNMRVNLPGEEDPITLENCDFYHGGEQHECHGEIGGYLPGQIFITILKTYDGPGENGDIGIRWWLDSERLSKKNWRGWLIYSLPYEELPLVYTTNPNPPEFKAVGDSWQTDVIGPFVLQHDGLACDAPEDMWSREVLEGFDIHLKIERVR